MASTAVVLKLIKMVVGKVELLRECFDDTHNRGRFQQFQTALHLASYLAKLSAQQRSFPPERRSTENDVLSRAVGVEGAGYWVQVDPFAASQR